MLCAYRTAPHDIANSQREQKNYTRNCRPVTVARLRRVTNNWFLRSAQELCAETGRCEKFSVPLPSINDVSISLLKRPIAIGHFAGDYSLGRRRSFEDLLDPESRIP